MNPSLAGLGQPATEPGAEKRCLNSELWHACAGPLVCLPNVGTRVVYFPQGHSEQIAATTNKEVERQIPNYPNLPAHLICQLHNVTMHVDAETDDVYAQMTLQPLRSEEQKESYVPIDMGASSKQPTIISLRCSRRAILALMGGSRFLVVQPRKCFLLWISLSSRRHRS